MVVTEPLEQRVLLSGASPDDSEVTLSLAPQVFEAESDLQNAVGRQEGAAWSTSVSLDDAGYMAQSQTALNLNAEVHTATFRLSVNNSEQDDIDVARLEVYDFNSGTALKSQTVSRFDFGEANTFQDFHLAFEADGSTAYGIRVYWLDAAAVKVDHVSVTEHPGARLANTTYKAETELQHDVGQVGVDGWALGVSLHDAGYVAKSPTGHDLAAGVHSVTLRLLVDNNTSGDIDIVRLEVFDFNNSATVFHERTISRFEFDDPVTYQDFHLAFEADGSTTYGFRTYWYDSTGIRIDRVTLTEHPGARLAHTVFEAETDIGYVIGHVDGTSLSATVADDSANYIVHSPVPLALNAEVHTVTFRAKIDNHTSSNDAIFHLHVYDGATGNTLHERTIRRYDFDAALTYQDFHIAFEAEEGKTYGFRAFWTDTAAVWVDNVTFTEHPGGRLAKRTFEAENAFAHPVGRADADGWSANTALDTPNYLAYKGHTATVTGAGKASFRLMVDNNTFADDQIVTIDVFDNATLQPLAQRTITRKEFHSAWTYQDFDLFYEASAGQSLQLRVFWHGNSYVRMDRVDVTEVPGARVDRVVYEAESAAFYHQIGVAQADGWRAKVGVDTPGQFMAYGPYSHSVPAGDHVATYRLLVDNHTANNANVVKIDVVDAARQQVLTSRILTRQQFNASWTYQDFALEFSSADDAVIELRTYWYGTSYVRLDKVTLDNGLSIADPLAESGVIVSNWLAEAGVIPENGLQAAGVIVADPPTKSISVDENVALGTLVEKFAAIIPDGDPVTYSLSGDDAGLFQIDSDGRVTVAGPIDYEADSQLNLIVEATNQNDTSYFDEFLLTVDVNDLVDSPAVFGQASYAFTIDEDEVAAAAVGTVSATDADGTTPVYAIVPGDGSDLFTIDASGTIKLAAGVSLDHETTPQYTLTVSASDGQNAPATATIEINIGDVDEAPAFPTLAPIEVTEDELIIGSVAAVDPEQLPLTYDIVGGDPLGLFTIDGSGVISVASGKTLDYEATQQHQLTISADDGNHLVTAVVTINVTDVNEAPSFATNGPLQLREDEAPAGTISASDPEQQPLSYAITAGDPLNQFTIDNNGFISVASGAVLDYETTPQYVLTISVSDGVNAAVTASVTINVTDAPVSIADVTTSLAEDAAAGAAVTQLIPTGDVNSLSWSIVDDPGSTDDELFTIDPDGTVRLAGTFDYETATSHSITVEVTDGHNTDTAVVTIDVTDANEAPTFVGAPFNFSIDETDDGTSPFGLLNSLDPDVGAADPVYVIVGGSGQGLFEINAAGELRVASGTSLDYETVASYTLDVEVRDAVDSTLLSVETVTINITDAPVSISDLTTSLAENAAIGTAVTQFIPTGDTNSLTWSIVNDPGSTDDELFSIDPDGTLRLAGTLDYETATSHSITIEVTDGLNTDTAVVTIDVLNENDNLPVFDPPASPFSIDENSSSGTAVGIVTATDADGTTPGYSIVDGTGGALFDINASGQISVASGATLDREVAADYTLLIEASNDGGTAVTHWVTVELTDINEFDPVFGAASYTWQIGEDAASETLVGTVSAIDDDAESGSPVYSIVSGNEDGKFAIDASSGEIALAAGESLDADTPPAQYQLQIEAADPDDALRTATVLVTINVLPVNDNAPIFGQPVYNANVIENSAAGTPVATVMATDADFDSLPPTYAITAGNEDGQFTIDAATGAITVAAAATLDYEVGPGQYTLTVEATDPDNAAFKDTATIVINVTDQQEAPVFNNAGPFQLAENETSVGTAVAVDPDDEAGGTITYSLGTGSDRFAIDAISGEITLTGSVDFEQSPTEVIEVIATDGDGVATSANVTINIQDAAPAIADVSTSLLDGRPTGTLVHQFASTGDTNSLTWSLSGADAAMFNIDSNGQLTLAAPLDYMAATSHQVTVTADDGTTTSNSVVTLTVVANQAPIFDSASYVFFLEEDAPYDGGVIVGRVSATDPENHGSLIYTIVGDSGPFALDSGTGDLSLVQPLDRALVGSYNIIVSVSDGEGASSTTDVRIDVLPAYDLDSSQTGVTLRRRFSVSEAATSGTELGSVASYELRKLLGGPIAFAMNGQNTDFSVDAQSGVLTLTGLVDHELASIQSLSIRASGQYGSLALTVAVEVEDVAEVSNETQQFSVEESVPPDAAFGKVNSGVTKSAQFSIREGGDSSRFAINATTGTLSFVGSVDAEVDTTLIFDVEIVDEYGGINTIPIEVLVVNVDEPVLFSQQHYDFDVDENQALNSPGTVTAIDPEGLPVTYRIRSSDESLPVTIGPDGSLLVSGPLDHEQTPSYTFLVEAWFDGTDQPAATSSVSLSINDVNELPTIISSAFTIDQRQVGPHLVGELRAVDPESADVSFEIVGGSDTFSIDGSRLLVNENAGPLQVGIHSLTIRVSDGSTSSDQVVSVTVIDNRLVAQVPSDAALSFVIQTDSGEGTLVGSLVPPPEIGSVSDLSFAITSGNDDGLFGVGFGGELVLAADWFSTNSETRELTILVTDSFGGTATLTVAVSLEPIVLPEVEYPQVANLRIGSAGSLNDQLATFDPTIEGEVIGISPESDVVIEVDIDDDGIADLTQGLSATGNFSIDLSGASVPGVVEIQVRATSTDLGGNVSVGDWKSLIFEYVDPNAPPTGNDDSAPRVIFAPSDDAGFTDPNADLNLTGTILAPAGQTGISVEFDRDGDGVSEQIVQLVNGVFSLTVDAAQIGSGSQALFFRAVLEDDTTFATVYGDWERFEINRPAQLAVPEVENLIAIDSTIDGQWNVTSDGMISGNLISGTFSTDSFIEILVDFDEDGLSDWAVTPEIDGTFQIDLLAAGLVTGEHTVALRARTWDPATSNYLEGTWVSLGIRLVEAESQPLSVENLLQTTAVGGEGIITGTLVNATLSYSQPLVEVDFDSDGVYDEIIVNIASDGSFEFALWAITPESFGSEIAFRAVGIDANGVQVLGNWTALAVSLDNVLPSFNQVGLLDPIAGAGNPTAARPIVVGSVADLQADSTYLVELEWTGDGVADQVVWSASDGTFEIDLTGDLGQPGSHTVLLTLIRYEPDGRAVRGDSTSFAFDWDVNVEPVDLPEITSVNSPSGPTSAPVISGVLSTVDDGADVYAVEFDFNGDGVVDGQTYADVSSGGEFVLNLLPYLTADGIYNVRLRVAPLQAVDGSVAAGDWTLVTVDFERTIEAAATIVDRPSVPTVTIEEENRLTFADGTFWPGAAQRADQANAYLAGTYIGNSGVRVFDTNPLNGLLTYAAIDDASFDIGNVNVEVTDIDGGTLTVTTTIAGQRTEHSYEDAQGVWHRLESLSATYIVTQDFATAGGSDYTVTLSGSYGYSVEAHGLGATSVYRVREFQNDSVEYVPETGRVISGNQNYLGIFEGVRRADGASDTSLQPYTDYFKTSLSGVTGESTSTEIYSGGFLAIGVDSTEYWDFTAEATVTAAPGETSVSEEEFEFSHSIVDPYSIIVDHTTTETDTIGAESIVRTVTEVGSLVGTQTLLYEAEGTRQIDVDGVQNTTVEHSTQNIIDDILNWNRTDTTTRTSNSGPNYIFEDKVETAEIRNRDYSFIVASTHHDDPVGGQSLSGYVDGFGSTFRLQSDVKHDLTANGSYTAPTGAFESFNVGDSNHQLGKGLFTETTFGSFSGTGSAITGSDITVTSSDFDFGILLWDRSNESFSTYTDDDASDGGTEFSEGSSSDSDIGHGSWANTLNTTERIIDGTVSIASGTKSHTGLRWGTQGEEHSEKQNATHLTGAASQGATEDWTFTTSNQNSSSNISGKYTVTTTGTGVISNAGLDYSETETWSESGQSNASSAFNLTSVSNSGSDPNGTSHSIVNRGSSESRSGSYTEITVLGTTTFADGSENSSSNYDFDESGTTSWSDYSGLSTTGYRRVDQISTPGSELVSVSASGSTNGATDSGTGTYLLDFDVDRTLTNGVLASRVEESREVEDRDDGTITSSVSSEVAAYTGAPPQSTGGLSPTDVRNLGIQMGGPVDNARGSMNWQNSQSTTSETYSDRTEVYSLNDNGATSGFEQWDRNGTTDATGTSEFQSLAETSRKVTSSSAAGTKEDEKTTSKDASGNGSFQSTTTSNESRRADFIGEILVYSGSDQFVTSLNTNNLESSTADIERYVTVDGELVRYESNDRSVTDADTTVAADTTRRLDFGHDQSGTSFRTELDQGNEVVVESTPERTTRSIFSTDSTGSDSSGSYTRSHTRGSTDKVTDEEIKTTTTWDWTTSNSGRVGEETVTVDGSGNVDKSSFFHDNRDYGAASGGQSTNDIDSSGHTSREGYFTIDASNFESIDSDAEASSSESFERIESGNFDEFKQSTTNRVVSKPVPSHAGLTRTDTINITQTDKKVDGTYYYETTSATPDPGIGESTTTETNYIYEDFTAESDKTSRTNSLTTGTRNIDPLTTLTIIANSFQTENGDSTTQSTIERTETTVTTDALAQSNSIESATHVGTSNLTTSLNRISLTQTSERINEPTHGGRNDRTQIESELTDSTVTENFDESVTIETNADGETKTTTVARSTSGTPNIEGTSDWNESTTVIIDSTIYERQAVGISPKKTTKLYQTDTTTEIGESSFSASLAKTVVNDFDGTETVTGDGGNSETESTVTTKTNSHSTKKVTDNDWRLIGGSANGYFGHGWRDLFETGDSTSSETVHTAGTAELVFGTNGEEQWGSETTVTTDRYETHDRRSENRAKAESFLNVATGLTAASLVGSLGIWNSNFYSAVLNGINSVLQVGGDGDVYVSEVQKLHTTKTTASKIKTVKQHGLPDDPIDLYKDPESGSNVDPATKIVNHSTRLSYSGVEVTTNSEEQTVENGVTVDTTTTDRDYQHGRGFYGTLTNYADGSRENIKGEITGMNRDYQKVVVTRSSPDINSWKSTSISEVTGFSTEDRIVTHDGSNDPEIVTAGFSSVEIDSDSFDETWDIKKDIPYTWVVPGFFEGADEWPDAVGDISYTNKGHHKNSSNRTLIQRGGADPDGKINVSVSYIANGDSDFSLNEKAEGTLSSDSVAQGLTAELRIDQTHTGTGNGEMNISMNYSAILSADEPPVIAYSETGSTDFTINESLDHTVGQTIPTWFMTDANGDMLQEHEDTDGDGLIDTWVDSSGNVVSNPTLVVVDDALDEDISSDWTYTEIYDHSIDVDDLVDAGTAWELAEEMTASWTGDISPFNWSTWQPEFDFVQIHAVMDGGNPSILGTIIVNVTPTLPGTPFSSPNLIGTTFEDHEHLLSTSMVDPASADWINIFPEETQSFFAAAAGFGQYYIDAVGGALQDANDGSLQDGLRGWTDGFLDTVNPFSHVDWLNVPDLGPAYRQADAYATGQTVGVVSGIAVDFAISIYGPGLVKCGTWAHRAFAAREAVDLAGGLHNSYQNFQDGKFGVMDAITVAGVGLNVSALGRASKKCFTAGHMIVTAPPADMAANVRYAAMSNGPDEAGDSITIAAALAGALGLLVIKGRRNRREREREMKPQGWQLLATGWDTSATPVGDVGVDLNREFDLNGGLDQSEPQRFLSTPQKSIVRIEEPQRDAAPLERPRRSRNSLWRRVIGLTLLLGSAAVLAGSFFLGEATATAVSTAAATQATVEEFDTSHRKPIEEIKVGDKVLARDEDGEAIGWQEVDEVYERTSDHLRFLKVRSESGETQTFETTDEHPFWSAIRGAWIDAGELKAGEKLTGPDGKTHTVVFTEREEHPEGVAVYNFRVAGAHTYFVAAVDAPRGPPVLVHNADYDVPGTKRDHLGNLHGSDGRFAYSGGPAGGNLGRPSLRAGTKRKILDDYLPLGNGRFKDKETGAVYDDFHFGHRKGYEHRRIAEAADQLDLSQKQLNDFVNSRPDYFQLQDRMDNLRHFGEKAGKGDIGDILDDMIEFLENGS
ncbi:Cadherin domain protein [Stratiformator vulcanicus]|uniref:Cadherin domain protein n=2 Tax=Stratiformator vulcanicus TaxID=2527980 RepID=A0A517QWL2_9PLAN|nr:Cadherin domain protein [Stratiformator vulcanicus]